MKLILQALLGAARAELIALRRCPLLLTLVIVQAITFMFLVSLFGMTGAMAPTAVVDYDLGGRAQAFIDELKRCHHSFDVKVMDEPSAMEALKHGKLVAMIVIPKGFTYSIVSLRNVPIKVVVDNIDTDMSEDIRRALPAAIVGFGHRLELPGLHVRTAETDLIDHDTGFVEYMVVSALVLAAFMISCNLSAVSVAREFESGTAKMLLLAPVHPVIPLTGRLLATCLVSLLALVITVLVALFGFRITILHPLEFVIVLAFSVFVFGILGVAVGAALKHTLPVASVVFGMALPLFMISGSYEPERFDGNLIWAIAHFSPLYYPIGIIEHAAHGLKVTPESVQFNFLAMALWTILFLGLAVWQTRQGAKA